MSADTLVVGYPVHRVATYTRWTNPHGAKFTDWTAACGTSNTTSGPHPFSRAGKARRLELCQACFPGRSCYGYYPDPVQVPAGGAP